MLRQSVWVCVEGCGTDTMLSGCLVDSNGNLASVRNKDGIDGLGRVGSKGRPRAQTSDDSELKVMHLREEGVLIC